MCQQYFFLRHGEVEGSGKLLGQRIDVSLSEEGRRQAEAWRKVLQEVPFQAIITSPARRAREMGEILRPEGVPFLQLPHFHEVSWGEWEGQPYDAIRPLLAEQAKRWSLGDLDFAPHGGETLSTIFRRIEEGLQLIASLYPTGSVLVITHGQLLRLLLVKLMDYPVAMQERFYHKRGQLSWLVRLPAGYFYFKAMAVDANTAF